MPSNISLSEAPNSLKSPQTLTCFLPNNFANSQRSGFITTVHTASNTAEVPGNHQPTDNQHQVLADS